MLSIRLSPIPKKTIFQCFATPYYVPVIICTHRVNIIVKIFQSIWKIFSLYCFPKVHDVGARPIEYVGDQYWQQLKVYFRYDYVEFIIYSFKIPMLSYMLVTEMIMRTDYQEFRIWRLNPWSHLTCKYKKQRRKHIYHDYNQDFTSFKEWWQ